MTLSEGSVAFLYLLKVFIRTLVPAQGGLFCILFMLMLGLGGAVISDDTFFPDIRPELRKHMMLWESEVGLA